MPRSEQCWGSMVSVLNPLMTVATSTSHTMDAHIALLATKSFGVGRGFAVLVAIFTLIFALMVLGGHLRASWLRKRRTRARDNPR
jgi:hypothetical protein